MLKLKLLIVALLISALAQAQIFKPHSGNWEAKGFWKFLKSIKVEGKDITAQKVDKWDSAYAAIAVNDVDIDNVFVKRSDSAYAKPGGYVSRYDFKSEPTKQEIVKSLNSAGAGIKLAPTMAVGAAMTGNNQLVDARASYIHCTVTDTVVVSSIHYSMAISGVYTVDGAEFNGIAIYSLSGTTATRVAITANTATAWSIAANDFSGLNLTAPVTLYPGEYYVGFLFNFLAQTTAPTIQSIQPGSLYTSMPLSNSRRLGIFYSGVSTFPASFTVVSTQTLGILHNFIGK